MDTGTKCNGRGHELHQGFLQPVRPSRACVTKHFQKGERSAGQAGTKYGEGQWQKYDGERVREFENYRQQTCRELVNLGHGG